ncbi:MAG TPA: chemotaxis protein CheA [Candidatus Acidoferrales bacterium]|nr:chemotaxis protein CheA [Candidatus Acidoferrales bacterium]
MNIFGDERGAELREIFFESAAELLQAMNEGGLILEERPADVETIRKVRRAVHTLKGDSASCGFRELSKLSHELEDVLTSEKVGSIGSALAEIVLAAADTFHTMLAAYREGQQPPPGNALSEHIRRLLAVASEPAPAATVPAAAATAGNRLAGRFAWTEYERLMISQAAGRGESVYNIVARLAPDVEMPAPVVQLVRSALQSVGTLLAFRPDESEDIAKTRQVEAALASSQKPDVLQRRCKIPPVISEVRVEPVVAAPTAKRDLLDILLESEAAAVASGISIAAAPAESSKQAPGVERRAASASSSGSSIAENTLRVEAGRIDNVMNLVGELIIGKSMLHRAILEFEKAHPKDPLRGRFSDAMAFQARVLNELQKSVMKIRMVPVEQLFRRFPRVVRDVAKERNKDIGLELNGQTTDLDKSILDALAEPLVHIVRNAADHGIESTPERIASGKPPRGTIRLNAFHQGNQVVVSISDDGRGLNRGKIVERAIESGIITKAEAERMNEAEALQLIFRPGLSTADQVTQISGRGVGMDIVQSVLQRMKGSVNIETEVGKGTTFLLMLPLTLASIQALMFRVSGRLYAVPLSSVVEITRAHESEVHAVDGREVLRLRDQILALVRLDQLCGAAPGPKPKRLFVVVISSGSRKFGLVVDHLIGEEELVMKALDDRVVSSDLVSGASILGDGTVVLILNIAAVISRFAKTAPLGAIA